MHKLDRRDPKTAIPQIEEWLLELEEKYKKLEEYIANNTETTQEDEVLE